MIVIGELINGTRAPVRAAIERGDAEFIADLAARQVAAGADYVDCNVGLVGEREVERMRWLVGVVAEAVDVPVCIDTASPAAMAAGLEEYRGSAPPIVNSVTLEAERAEAMLAVLAGASARVIALAMTDEGVPTTGEARAAAGRRLLDLLSERGIAVEDVFVDLVITPLSVDPEGARAACAAMQMIATTCPQCHLVCGLSNVSFGLPQRALLHRAFVAQAIAAGLDSAILDPTDAQLRATMYAAEALAGRDPWCARYLRAYREGLLQE